MIVQPVRSVGSESFRLDRVSLFASDSECTFLFKQSSSSCKRRPLAKYAAVRSRCLHHDNCSTSYNIIFVTMTSHGCVTYIKLVYMYV